MQCLQILFHVFKTFFGRIFILHNTWYWVTFIDNSHYSQIVLSISKWQSTQSNPLKQTIHQTATKQSNWPTNPVENSESIQTATTHQVNHPAIGESWQPSNYWIFQTTILTKPSHHVACQILSIAHHFTELTHRYTYLLRSSSSFLICASWLLVSLLFLFWGA